MRNALTIAVAVLLITAGCSGGGSAAGVADPPYRTSTTMTTLEWVEEMTVVFNKFTGHFQGMQAGAENLSMPTINGECKAMNRTLTSASRELLPAPAPRLNQALEGMLDTYQSAVDVCFLAVQRHNWNMLRDDMVPLMMSALDFQGMVVDEIGSMRF